MLRAATDLAAQSGILIVHSALFEAAGTALAAVLAIGRQRPWADRQQIPDAQIRRHPRERWLLQSADRLVDIIRLPR